MATDTYTGPQGGDWFDPANWSLDATPVPGNTVDLFGANGPSLFADVTAPPDPASNAPAGLTIDVSGTNGQSTGEAGLYEPSLNLEAGQLGTTTAPVSVAATADSGTTDSAVISFTTLDGSLGVAAGQALDVAANIDIFQTGVTINGNVDVASGARLSFVTEAMSSYVVIPPEPVILNGQTTVDGGTLSVYTSDLGGSGSVTIDNGGSVVFPLTMDEFAVASLPISFGSGGGTLDLSGSLGPFNGSISGFGPGDVIKANNLGFGGGPVDARYADGVLTVTSPDYPFEQQFSFVGDYTSANFQLVEQNLDYEILYAPCFATGTAIATTDGDRPVETLAVGQIALLHDGTAAPITWVGHRRQRNGHVVRIRAGALGNALPQRDLVVSADHGIYLGGVLVQAGLLANSDTITTEPREHVTFWHVELERHGILLAEGAPAESYIDTGNRRQFGNCPLAYDPVSPTQEPCAEMVFAGERLQRIRAGLEVHAMA